MGVTVMDLSLTRGTGTKVFTMGDVGDRLGMGTVQGHE